MTVYSINRAMSTRFLSCWWETNATRVPSCVRCLKSRARLKRLPGAYPSWRHRQRPITMSRSCFRSCSTWRKRALSRCSWIRKSKRNRRRRRSARRRMAPYRRTVRRVPAEPASRRSAALCNVFLHYLQTNW